MNLRLSKNTYLSLTLIYMAFIMYMSLKPYAHTAPPSTLREFLHNALHVPAYGIMALLLYLTISARGMTDSRKMMNKSPSHGLWTIDHGLVFSFIIAFSYGALLEILQGLSPGRDPSVIDLCSNAFGAGVMLWLVNIRNIGVIYLGWNPKTSTTN